jgi:HD superfamily phosphohydrolase
LGIIDLDDEEWGEEENEVKITQKLPLKKIYKLSPNVGTLTKHQRIRSKRYFSQEFDSHDKIIVD